MLADTAYGRSAKFRDTVRLLGFDYAVGVDSTTKIVVLGPGGRWSNASMTAMELARKLGKKVFRQIT